MGWFDSPAISIRKQLPDGLLTGLNLIENFARESLDQEPIQKQPYQIAIVLALWIKAGEMSGEFAPPAKASRRIQDIYASCVKTIRSDAYQAYKVAENLAEQDSMFGMPPDLYRQLQASALGVF